MFGAERFEMSREIAVTASASLGLQQRAGPPGGDVGTLGEPGLLWESGGAGGCWWDYLGFLRGCQMNSLILAAGREPTALE